MWKQKWHLRSTALGSWMDNIRKAYSSQTLIPLWGINMSAGGNDTGKKKFWDMKRAKLHSCVWCPTHVSDFSLVEDQISVYHVALDLNKASNEIMTSIKYGLFERGMCSRSVISICRAQTSFFLEFGHLEYCLKWAWKDLVAHVFQVCVR